MPLRKTSKLRKTSDWDEFENMCTDLVEREWDASDAQGYGRQGQTQNGVDILCTPYWMEKQDCAIQVKNTDDLSWDDIEDEISSVEGSDLEISEFYLFTTMDSDVHLQKKVKKENAKRKKNDKFEIELWMWDKITRKMAEYEDMLKSYYPESELDFSTKENQKSKSLADWRDEKIDELMNKEEIEKYEAMEDSSPYRHGYYAISYELIGNFEEKSANEFRKVLRKSKYSSSGWTMWSDLPGGSTYANGGDIEYLRLEDPAHSDFWVASPSGKLLLVRGYDSDSMNSEKSFSKGEKLDVHLPVWKVSEAVFHAKNLVEELGVPVEKVNFNIKWTGLRDRSLYTDRVGFMPREYLCKQNSVEIESKIDISEIESNLEQMLEDLTKDLYQEFNFFDPTEGLYEREAEKIIKNKN